MPIYKYINRCALMWSLLFSLIVSIALLITGSATWQTIIIEEAMYKTKTWNLCLGLCIILLTILGFFSLEAGSKGLSWLYIFCTISVALILFVHTRIDFSKQGEMLADTRAILKESYIHYGNDTVDKNKIDNFQTRLRCCGLFGKEDPRIQTKYLKNFREQWSFQTHKKEFTKSKTVVDPNTGLIASCCGSKIKKCIAKYAWDATCFDKAKHVIHISNLCCTLGLIAAFVQVGVLMVLGWGGIQFIYHIVFPPGGPIIVETF